MCDAVILKIEVRDIEWLIVSMVLVQGSNFQRSNFELAEAWLIEGAMLMCDSFFLFA